MSEIEFDTFENVLHRKIVVIPDYQRDYSWTKAEIETLAEDIQDLYDRNLGKTNEPLFLGAIVFIPFDKDISSTAKRIENNNKLSTYRIFNVIDGQQRLATLSILFISIRDYAKKRNISFDEAQTLTNMIDTGKTDSEGNRIPLLHFSHSNTQKCFNSFLYPETNEKCDRRKQGARRLSTAKSIFDKRLADFFDKFDDDTASEHLGTYVNQLLYNLEFVEIDCREGYDAFQIFESLNSTGIPLTPADQIKNLILMNSANKDVSLRSWESIVEKTGEDYLVDFLTQYMFCKHNHRVSKKDVYNVFKDVLSKTAVSNVLDEMCEFSKLYEFLLSPSGDTEAALAIRDLNDLGQRQVYVPLLLAAKRFAFKKQFAQIADSLLVFIVRHQVCLQSSNKLDTIFSNACEIIKNEANTAKDIINYFRNQQMDDDSFEKSFSDLSFQYSAAPQRKAKVYLKRIEEKERGADTPLPLKEFELTVEHIIPKQPSIDELESWVGKKEADRIRKEDPELVDFSERTIMNVGNLALLYRPENSSATNGTYDEKRASYTSAVIDENKKNRGIPAEIFTLIKELLEDYPSSFNAKCVESRAEKLAEKAKNAWK